MFCSNAVLLYQIGNSARTREDTSSIASTKWAKHGDYTIYFGQDGCEIESKLRQSFATNRYGDFRQETERRVQPTDDATSLKSALHYSLACGYNEEQNSTLGSDYRNATMPFNGRFRDSILPSNEESSLLNIKITSAFSLRSNISDSSNGTESPKLKLGPGEGSKIPSPYAQFPVLWQPYEQMKSATAKNEQTQKASFDVMCIKKETRGSQISKFYFDEDVGECMIPDEVRPIYGQRGYTRLKISQEIAAENPAEFWNQTLPDHWYTNQEGGVPTGLLRQDNANEGALIKPTKTEFQTKSNELDLHQRVCIHFPKNVLYKHDGHPSTKYSQATQNGQNPRHVSTEKCQKDNVGPMPRPFETTERIKQAQTSDKSTAADTISRGMPLSTSSGDHHLPDVCSHWTQCDSSAHRWLVDYTRKVQKPWKPQNWFPENLDKFQMKNGAQQQSNFLREMNLDETYPRNAPLVVGRHPQKTITWKAANHKRTFPSTQILVTPEPELFETLKKKLSLENDEEPIVKVPNYLMDFTTGYTQDISSSPELGDISLKANMSSQFTGGSPQPKIYPRQNAKDDSVDRTVTTDDSHKMETSLEYMKTQDNVTMERTNRAGEPPTQLAATFLSKSSPKDFALHFCKDENAKSIPTSEVFAGVSYAPTVHEFHLHNKNPTPARSDERQSNGLLIPTTFNKPYKRTGGAQPSIRPTPDFSRLLPSCREVICEHPTRQDFVVSCALDQKPEVKEKTLRCFSEKFKKINRSEFEQEDRLSTIEDGSPLERQDARIPNNINNLPELKSSTLTNCLTGEKNVFYQSGNACQNGSFEKQIALSCTETYVGRNTTTEFHEGRKHQCEVCGRAFSRSNTLTTHKRIHTGDRPFPCDLCGKTFRQLGNLTRHKLTHDAFKPHACPKCNKSFSRTSNLNTHLRTHTNYKPFVCDFCGKGFHQKVDMKIHRYTHTGEKPHKCSTCGRGFKQLTHLKYHTRTHSDVRMYKCQHCGKGFNQKGNLQAHIYGHTGDRPYKCEICGKGFTLTSTLNTHKRTHVPDKPFKCEFCEKAFYQKNALKTHYISSHPYTDGVCLL